MWRTSYLRNLRARWRRRTEQHQRKGQCFVHSNKMIIIVGLTLRALRWVRVSNTRDRKT